MSGYFISRPSFPQQLTKLSPSHRNAIKKKIGHALNLKLYESSERPSLDECFKYLGQMHTRLRFLEKVQDLIHHGLGTTFVPWSQELWALKVNSQKQIDLMGQLIDCHLAKGDKIYETCPGTESRGTEPATDASGSGEMG